MGRRCITIVSASKALSQLCRRQVVKWKETNGSSFTQNTAASSNSTAVLECALLGTVHGGE